MFPQHWPALQRSGQTGNLSVIAKLQGSVTALGSGLEKSNFLDSYLLITDTVRSIEW